MEQWLFQKCLLCLYQFAKGLIKQFNILFGKVIVSGTYSSAFLIILFFCLFWNTYFIYYTCYITSNHILSFAVAQQCFFINDVLMLDLYLFDVLSITVSFTHRFLWWYVYRPVCNHSVAVSPHSVCIVTWPETLCLKSATNPVCEESSVCLCVTYKFGVWLIVYAELHWKHHLIFSYSLCIFEMTWECSSYTNTDTCCIVLFIIYVPLYGTEQLMYFSCSGVIKLSFLHFFSCIVVFLIISTFTLTLVLVFSLVFHT